MSNNQKKKRIAISFLTPIISFIVLCLFTFSINEEEENKNFQKSFKSNYKIFSLTVPDSLNFAGEPIPIELIDVKEKMDRELLVNTYWQSNTLLYIKRSNNWFPIIDSILKEEGVPSDFKYLALIESGLTQIVSPAGAAGFWQILKKTAPEYGLEVNIEIDERYNVEKSTVAACKYLKEAKEKFGSWTLAAASYNMGQAGLKKQLKRQDVNSYYDLLLNTETSRYLFRIVAVKQILTHPNEYGFNYRIKDLYPKIEYETVLLDSSVTNFVNYAASFGINYKVLKYLNPWLREKKLYNSKGKTYKIKIPTKEFIGQLQTKPPTQSIDTIEVK